MQPTETHYMTPAQVSHRLGLTTQRVRQLANTGVLPCVVTPLGRLFAVEDVERLAGERDTYRNAPVV